MTQVEFHTGVVDGVSFVCRLVRKAYRQGEAVLVTAPAHTLQVLDRALWTFAAHEFVPHCRLGASPHSPAVMARSPIWLSPGPLPRPCPAILVNLGAPMPDDLDPFNRVIEVLATDPVELHAGRARWRSYAAKGLNIKHHTAGAAS